MSDRRGRWWYLNAFLFTLQTLFAFYYLYRIVTPGTEIYHYVLLAICLLAMALLVWVGHMRQKIERERERLRTPPSIPYMPYYPSFTTSMNEAVNESWAMTLIPMLNNPLQCERCGRIHESMSEAYEFHAARLKWLKQLPARGKLAGFSAHAWLKRETEFLDGLTYAVDSK